jgi:hypothetical protein
VAIGFSFALRSPNSMLPTGSLAISVGCCLFALSIPLQFVMNRRYPETKREEHRRVYEYYFSERRVLNFDEHSLSYAYGESKNIVPWTDLISFAEYPGVIVLYDRFVQYMVRKSALTAEVQEELKQRCNKGLNRLEGEVLLPRKLGGLEYARRQISQRWRRQTFRMAALYLVGSIGASILAVIFAGAFPIRMWPFAIALFLLMPLSEVVLGLVKFRANQEQLNYEGAVFTASSVCFWDKGRVWKLDFKWLSDWRETSREFCLFVSDELTYAFSKSNLKQDQIVRIHEILSAVKTR